MKSWDCQSWTGIGIFPEPTVWLAPQPHKICHPGLWNSCHPLLDDGKLSPPTQPVTPPDLGKQHTPPYRSATLSGAQGHHPASVMRGRCPLGKPHGRHSLFEQIPWHCDVSHWLRPRQTEWDLPYWLMANHICHALFFAMIGFCMFFFFFSNFLLFIINF